MNDHDTAHASAQQFDDLDDYDMSLNAIRRNDVDMLNGNTSLENASDVDTSSDCLSLEEVSVLDNAYGVNNAHDIDAVHDVATTSRIDDSDDVDNAHEDDTATDIGASVVDTRDSSVAPRDSGVRFAVVNLGCKVNRTESDEIAAAYLSSGGVRSSQEDADVIIINTCTVTGEADKKARKAAHHAATVNDHARILVTGCAAAIEPKEFERIDSRIEIAGKASIARSARGSSERSVLRLGNGFHTRVNIKVQDGCDHACTYCIVHVARGAARSRSASSVEQEARAYLARGVREIVLTGINLGSYASEGLTLAGLAGRLMGHMREEADAGTSANGSNRCGVEARLRIGSIEPQDVGADLVALLGLSDGTLCRHLHLPLQSGSDRVLAEMNRPYDVGFYTDLVERLYAAAPGMSLSTDVIVGFPGETDKDFQETLDLCRRCRFSKIHVFPYSLREGTPAAKRADQIPPAVKKERARVLRELGAQLRAEDLLRRAGSSEYALVETDRCVTESYHELPLPAGVPTGSLISVSMPAHQLKI